MSLPIKLFVSNLHYNVSDRDLMELFSEFGCITEATVHYNKFGYSLGTGHVIFRKENDAATAYDHYDGIYLDGQPLIITCMGQPVPAPHLQRKLPVKIRLSPTPSGRNKPLKRLAKGPYKHVSQKRQQEMKAAKEKRKNAKKSGLKNKGKIKHKIQTSALELDKELEEYTKRRDAKPASSKESVNEQSLVDISDVSFQDHLLSAGSTSEEESGREESVAPAKLMLDENDNLVSKLVKVPTEGAIKSCDVSADLQQSKGSPHSGDPGKTFVLDVKVQKFKEEPGTIDSLLAVDIGKMDSRGDIKIETYTHSLDSGVCGLRENAPSKSSEKSNPKRKSDDFTLILEGLDENTSRELSGDLKESESDTSASDVREEVPGRAAAAEVECEVVPENEEEDNNEETPFDHVSNIPCEQLDENAGEPSKETVKVDDINHEDSVESVKDQGDSADIILLSTEIPENVKETKVPKKSTAKKAPRRPKRATDANAALELSLDDYVLETPENVGSNFRIKRKIELEGDNISPSQDTAEGGSVKVETSEKVDEYPMKPPHIRRKVKTRPSLRNAPKKKENYT